MNLAVVKDENCSQFLVVLFLGEVFSYQLHGLYPCRSIDLHTNIATAIVSEITARGLDKLFEAEDNFENGSLASSLQQLEKLLDRDEKGMSRFSLCVLHCYNAY